MIEDNVGGLIVDAIDLQIGYFRQNEMPQTPYQITVKSFGNLPNSDYISQELFSCRDGNEQLFFNSKKLVIEKTDKGYLVYAKCSNNSIDKLCFIEV